MPASTLPRRLPHLLLVASLLMFAACTASTQGNPSPSGAATGPASGSNSSSSGKALLVTNNQTTANPSLVPGALGVPAGFPAVKHTVSLPPGFSISLIAAGLSGPRFMTFDPYGNLVVGAAGGNVYRFPAAEGSIAPAPKAPLPLLSGLQVPHSVAFDNGYLYVAETGRISRYTYNANAALGPRQVVVPNLPAGGHVTRTVVFGTDGKMYVGIGSSCNICTEKDERRAAVSRYNPDGSGYERVAWGTRNPVGLAFQPGTGLLWATVNERDNQGNEIPPDLVTIIHEGANYGWPECQPPSAKPQDRGDACNDITAPTVAIQAHSAALGLAFYTGKQFPAEYQNDLFVAQHGSWNRQPPAPPKLIRLHFENGSPVSATDFATGWQTDTKGSRWGRPVGIVVAPDGTLIVSDDSNTALYRISYSG